MPSEWKSTYLWYRIKQYPIQSNLQLKVTPSSGHLWLTDKSSYKKPTTFFKITLWSADVSNLRTKIVALIVSNNWRFDCSSIIQVLAGFENDCFLRVSLRFPVLFYSNWYLFSESEFYVSKKHWNKVNRNCSKLMFFWTSVQKSMFEGWLHEFSDIDQGNRKIYKNSLANAFFLIF